VKGEGPKPKANTNTAERQKAKAEGKYGFKLHAASQMQIHHCSSCLDEVGAARYTLHGTFAKGRYTLCAKINKQLLFNLLFAN